MKRSFLFLAIALVGCRQTPNDDNASVASGDPVEDSRNDGFVEGSVVDGEGEGLDMVSVVLRRVASDSTIYGAVTGPDGSFWMSGLQSGRYALHASGPGVVGTDTIDVSAGDTSHTTVVIDF